MTLSEDDLDQLAAVALNAARQAADYVRGEAGRDREVSTKEGGNSDASQVVTEVDFESQRLILETLAPSIGDYDLGLLTEERADDGSRHTRDYFWCIDPLDGTLAFTEGVAGYSVSIALVSRAGVPQTGVIADPLTGAIYHARRGAGAFKEDAQLQVSRPGGAELTLVMDRSFAQQPEYDALLAQVADIAVEHGLSGVGTIGQGGAAMNAIWAIENAPAIYFKLPKPEDGGGSLWDYAASACLFAELGSPATDIAGRPLLLNRRGSTFMNGRGIAYASHPELSKAITGRFGGVQGAADSRTV